MIVGSFGKEFTDKDTKVVRNYNNLWVKVIDKELRVTHVVSDVWKRISVLLWLPWLLRSLSSHCRGRVFWRRTQDWRKAYTDMRAALGFSSPGYLLHETGIWNPYSRKWIFLPRRASKLEYDDTKDESRGTNLLIEATENFDSFNYVTVGVSDVVSLARCLLRVGLECIHPPRLGVLALAICRPSSTRDVDSRQQSLCRVPTGVSLWR